MRTSLTPLLACALVTACAPAPARDPETVVPAVEVTVAPVVEAPPAETTLPASEAHAGGLSCRCDVLGFESDGPPQGSCTLAFDADGVGTLKGVTSKPPFSARLVPIPGKKRKVDYVFEGDFDFACDEDWCGHQQLSVLAVAEHDYRVTVARSDDGPPSHVLWVTCTQE